MNRNQRQEQIMPWYKITLTEKQLSENESKKLVAAFQKVYNRHNSQVANMALFGVEGDNCTFYFNTIASTLCGKIIEDYSAIVAKPSRQLHRLAGEVGPQIFDS